MTKPEFDAAVDTLLVRFCGSLISGRRTTKRTLAVGGFAGDPHTWGLGADVVWDDPPTDAIFLEANDLNLHLIRERTHDHLQPLDFPAGVVTSYGGMTRMCDSA